jgi:energy-coupling factor transport system substrate-specific component
MLTPRSWRNAVLAALVGSILYAVSIYVTAILNIPGADNVQLRPGIAIPVVCGALFGPVAGFVSGALGNLLADQALGWGFWLFWYFGNGLLGLFAGLARPRDPNYARLPAVLGVIWRSCVGIILGMGLASLSERWVTHSSWDDVVYVNFVPAALSNLANALVLVPIILLLYGLLREATRLDEVYGSEAGDA